MHKSNKTSQSLFWVLTILCSLISILGLIAIYNASVVEGFHDFGDKFYFVKQQSKWLIAGLAIYFSASFVKPKFWQKISGPFFLLSLFLLVIVLIPGLGLKLLGARRWLSLGIFSFQPSELLKISLVLYLSNWLLVERSLKSFSVIIGLCLGLIMLQPDLGTAVIVSSVGFGLYYLSGSNIKEIVIFISCLLMGVAVLIFSSPYRLERLHTFLDPTVDPLGRSYHVNQILLGLGSGGMFGVGLGRSRQKYSYLPEATTDSIFTIVGEEMGFVGASFLILLLLLVSLIGFKIASFATTKNEKLIAAGIAIIFTSQYFVNLCSMVALVPLTGVPLPLISYGGSSLITTFIGLGILASIARKHEV